MIKRRKKIKIESSPTKAMEEKYVILIGNVQIYYYFFQGNVQFYFIFGDIY